MTRINPPKTGLYFMMINFIVLSSPGVDLKKDYPIQPVAFTQVQVHDVFWAPKMETNRTVTVPSP